MTDQRLTPQEEQEIREWWQGAFVGTAATAEVVKRALIAIPKVLAEIDRLRGEWQWLPIATAPKDGTPVLVVNTKGTQRVCWWLPDSGNDDGPGWVFYQRYAGGCVELLNPTHWMPLPDATVQPRPQRDEQPWHAPTFPKLDEAPAPRRFSEAEVRELMRGAYIGGWIESDHPVNEKDMQQEIDIRLELHAKHLHEPKPDPAPATAGEPR